MVYLVAAAVIIILSQIAHYTNSNTKFQNMKKRIKSIWGKEPKVAYENNAFTSISSHFKNKLEMTQGTHFVDDITWHDLDMDEVFIRINNTQSSIGEEYLYSILREPLTDEKLLKHREKLINFFQSSGEKREKLQYILAKLDKKRFVNISDYFYGDAKKSSRSALKYKVLSIVGVLALGSLIFSIGFGVTVMAISFLINMTVYYRAKNRIGSQLESISYVLGMINCAKKIADSNIEELGEYNTILKEAYKKVRKINKKSFNLLYTSGDPLSEYAKIALLSELVAFESILKMMSDYSQDLKKIYEIVGHIDSLISIASYRQSIAYYTAPGLAKPDPDSAKHLEFKEAYHPLIKDPVANSLEASKPILLTGSNASGKSTFLKSTAINVILAQTIYTCLAKEYNSCYFKVFTSMALKDSLKNNESYYIAETKSLKRIIDNLGDDLPCICFIDEILRGTNTIERIAASSQVLLYLSKSNCLPFAATHDIELTRILNMHFENYHFEEKFIDNQIIFDYVIHHGRSNTRNAIKLLKIIGYNDSIVNNAEKSASNFANEGIWKELER